MALKVLSVVCGLLVATVANLGWADYSRVTVNSAGDDTLDSAANGLCTLREAIGVFNKTNNTKNTDCKKVVDTTLTANEVDIPYSISTPAIFNVSLTAANGAIEISPDAPLNIKGSITVIQGVIAQASAATVIHPAFNTDGTTILATFTSLTDGIFNIVNTGTAVPIEISRVSLWQGKGNDGGAIKSALPLTLIDSEIRDSVATGSGSAIYSQNADLTLTRTFIFDNKSTVDAALVKSGAAIVQKAGKLTMNDSMVAGNISTFGAGGVDAENADVDMNFVTLAYNSTSDATADAAGFIQTGTNSLIISNSVLSGNNGAGNAESECKIASTVSITSLYNALSQIDNAKCGLFAAEGSSPTSHIDSNLVGPLVRDSLGTSDLRKIVSPYNGSKLISGAAQTGDRSCGADDRDARGYFRHSSEDVVKECGKDPKSINANVDAATEAVWTNCATFHKNKGDLCDIGAIESRGAPIGNAGSVHLYRATAIDFDPVVNIYLSESIPDVTSPDSLKIITPPANGTAEIEQVSVTATDGTGVTSTSLVYKIKYTPKPGYTTDSLTYSVNDYNGYNITSDVSIQIDSSKKPKSGGAFTLSALLGLLWLKARANKEARCK